MEMDRNGDCELLQALRQDTEPDSQFLFSLVRIHAYLNDFSVLSKALLVAASRGFLNPVQILLEAGASPNARFKWYEDTPLHICSGNKHCAEMVRELLKRGADVNAVNRRKRTPLHVASFRQCVENMQELLNNGAIVNDVDDEGRTPLILCLIYEHPVFTAVKVLLDAGADVNLSDTFGRTPLHFALTQLQVTRLLLQHKADASVRDKFGDTPLHAAYKAHTTMASIRELLKSGVSLNTLNNSGHSALYCAVYAKNEEVTQQLLRCGARFDVVICLAALRDSLFGSLKIPAIAKELMRYAFMKNPDSLESIRPQLMQDRVVYDLRKFSSPECNLENFKHACLSEVDVFSNLSCDCGKSSIWGSINNNEDCSCDTDQAILKFLFSEPCSNFTDSLFHKLSNEFLLKVTLNLVSYFEIKECKRRVMLNGDCVKEIERYVSFEDTKSFLQSKQSEMDASEFEKFLEYMKGESFVKSSNDISLPGP